MAKKRASRAPVKTSKIESLLKVRRFDISRAHLFRFKDGWISRYEEKQSGVESVPLRLEAAIREYLKQTLPLTDRRLFFAKVKLKDGETTYRHGEADALMKSGKNYTIFEVKASASTNILSSAKNTIRLLGSFLSPKAENIYGCVFYLEMLPQLTDYAYHSLSDLKMKSALSLLPNMKTRAGDASVIMLRAEEVWDWAITHGLETDRADFDLAVERHRNWRLKLNEKLTKKKKAPQKNDVPSLRVSELVEDSCARLRQSSGPDGFLFSLAEAQKLTAEELRRLYQENGLDLRQGGRDLALGFLSLDRLDLVLQLEELCSIIKRYFTLSDGRFSVIQKAASSTCSEEDLLTLKVISKMYEFDASVEEALSASQIDEIRLAVSAEISLTSEDALLLTSQLSRKRRVAFAQ